jgi:hypothetical protein
VRRDIEDVLTRTRQPFVVTAMDSGAPAHLAVEPAVPSPRAAADAPAVTPTVPPPAAAPRSTTAQATPRSSTENRSAPPHAAPVKELSLRRRVHDALEANVLPGDKRDNTQLLELVGGLLDLSDLERVTATSYVRSWRRDAHLESVDLGHFSQPGLQKVAKVARS